MSVPETDIIEKQLQSETELGKVDLPDSHGGDGGVTIG
jgi:hypothetical protein